MKLLHQIFANEVYPALGCTEPIACAYAASLAASLLGKEFDELAISVDCGTYKNGSAVIIPNTQGGKGNLLAAVLGALVACPEKKLEILSEINEENLQKAHSYIKNKKAQISCQKDISGFRVEVTLTKGKDTARAVLEKGHVNIASLENNGIPLASLGNEPSAVNSLQYRQDLKGMQIEDFFPMLDELDDEDFSLIKKGIEMNLALASKGPEQKRTAFVLQKMNEDGLIANDIFYRTKLAVSSGIDARMSGAPLPAMTSGGSGNQGILNFLIPYLVGQEIKTPEKTILKSIALGHLINSYVKSYLGPLSVLCGCALGAGIASASAIVYQKNGPDLAAINLAINNVISDLSGLVCDGAKPSCSMKGISSADSVIRSAMMALNGYGTDLDDGIIGSSAEESIRNLADLGLEGMMNVDPTVIKIISQKFSRKN